MSIYLDIILFENLCMNYIILFATGIVMKRKMKQSMLIISSLIGSIYAIIVYLKITQIASTIIMKIVLSIAMVFIAFRDNSYKKFFKDLMMFYLVSFIFGGCSFALIYFLSPQNVKINNGVLVGTYPIKVTLVAGVVAFIIIQIAFKITKNKLSPDDMICKIEIYLKNKKLTVNSLIDSGNMLKDPISGAPVLVIEKEKIKPILPDKLLNIIEQIEGGAYEENEINEYLSKIKMIPFSSLGKQNGMLVGVKAEKIKVNFRDVETYVDNIVLGIYSKKLTKDNRYNALIGLNVLEESEEYEYSTNFKG